VGPAVAVAAQTTSLPIDATDSGVGQAVGAAEAAIQTVSTTSLDSVEVALSAPPAAELTSPAAVTQSISPAPATRVRVRRKAARRARSAAAGVLHRAERWLRSGELEADRL